MTKETFNNLLSTIGLVTVKANNYDITNNKDVEISYECKDGNCTSSIFIVDVTVKYKDIVKTKTFTVEN